MTYKYAKGYPITIDGEDFLFPSPTKIGKDFNDDGKLRAFTQWGANQTVEWIKQNCAHSDGMFPHWKVNDEQLNNARFNFRDVSDEALRIGSAVHAAIEAYLKTGKEPKYGYAIDQCQAFWSILCQRKQAAACACCK